MFSNLTIWLFNPNQLVLSLVLGRLLCLVSLFITSKAGGDDDLYCRKQSSSSFSSCSNSSELQSLPLTKRVVSSSSTSLNNSSPRLTKTPRKTSSRQTELADIQSDVETDQPQPLPEPQPAELRRPGGGQSQTRSALLLSFPITQYIHLSGVLLPYINTGVTFLISILPFLFYFPF